MGQINRVCVVFFGMGKEKAKAEEKKDVVEGEWRKVGDRG